MARKSDVFYKQPLKTSQKFTPQMGTQVNAAHGHIFFKKIVPFKKLICRFFSNSKLMTIKM